MKIKKRILSLALAGTMVLGLMPGMTMTALADEDTSTYTLTIPSTLNVANSGWNATDGISATGALADGKKLTVNASSDGEFALVSGENKVNYKLAESGDENTTYADATEKTSWEFTELSSTATTKPMGIIVEDYSTKPAGTYQDTVTFTAKVEVDYVPKTFTTLQSGDVIRVGDTIDSSDGINGDGKMLNKNYTHTLVRGDITSGGMFSDLTFTESDEGAYYFWKSTRRSDGAVRYSGTVDLEGNLDKGFFIIDATSTSDGIVATKSGNYWSFAVHEP